MAKKYGTCAVYDLGVFSFVAERLADEFETVYYFTPTGEPFPQITDNAAGEGVRSIIRVREQEFFDVVRDSELVVFPYLYTSGLQEFLRDQGYATWGSGRASSLELDRWGTHQLMEGLGMPVPEAELITGVDALEEYVREQDDCYIKVSYWRGDFETFHHFNFEVTKAFLDGLRYKLGPLQKTYQFIVEQPIQDAVEGGCDGYFVDGQFGPIGAIGYEVKEAGYIGKILNYEDIPAPLKYTIDKFGPLLKGTATNFSNEARVLKDGTPYMIDPCMRCGSPPTECMMEAFANWGEIMYEGARGNIIMPEPTCKYFAQVQVHSSWVKDNWMPLVYPKSISKWVKCYAKVVVDDKIYAPKTSDSTDVLAVTAIGNSMEETIETCMDRLEQIQGMSLDKMDDVFDRIMDNIEEGEKHGIDW